MKNNHSITLSDEAWNEIKNLALAKGHSTSQEIQYLILNQKANENAIKTIFAELASIKKNLQDRFQC